MCQWRKSRLKNASAKLLHGILDGRTLFASGRSARRRVTGARQRKAVIYQKTHALLRTYVDPHSVVGWWRSTVCRGALNENNRVAIDQSRRAIHGHCRFSWSSRPVLPTRTQQSSTKISHLTSSVLASASASARGVLHTQIIKTQRKKSL